MSNGLSPAQIKKIEDEQTEGDTRIGCLIVLICGSLSLVMFGIAIWTIIGWIT